jgi:hypothetical protein
MHLDLNSRDGVRFNQFFDGRHMRLLPGSEPQGIQEGFEAAVYNAEALTHMSPEKNPPMATALTAGCDRKIAAGNVAPGQSTR